LMLEVGRRTLGFQAELPDDFGHRLGCGQPAGADDVLLVLIPRSSRLREGCKIR
jgi:hypothetical protein